jgi:type IV pilus biogenesis protein CpaD/CtpE
MDRLEVVVIENSVANSAGEAAAAAAVGEDIAHNLAAVGVADFHMVVVED